MRHRHPYEINSCLKVWFEDKAKTIKTTQKDRDRDREKADW